METKKAICMWCHSHCPVQVTVDQGRLVKDEAAKNHPNFALFDRIVTACPRARQAGDWFHHPDRLSYPLKRVGERGSDKWETIPWEQALDEIAGKVVELREKYGPETLATSSGTYRTQDEYRARFMNLFGSPNHVGQGHICYAPSNLLSSALIGWPTNAGRIYPETKCLLLLGANPAPSARALWFPILDAKKQGAKLIVVDPRRTETAERADIWLQLRPGTDTALYMGMINVIISEGLYDREFVAKWCYGFDKLAERARQYPLERVAQITWVPEEKVLEAARVFATNKPAAVFNMMGLEHLTNSMEALHARFILPAITGNIEIRGGALIRLPHPQVVNDYEIELNDALPLEQRQRAIGAERFRFQTLTGFDLVMENLIRVWGTAFGKCHCAFAHAPSVYRAMLTGQPYPVRAMITSDSNPLVTHANTKLVYRALKSLDFYVVLDFWMTPCAELADYVLPAACWLEKPWLWDHTGYGNYVFASEAALPNAIPGEYDHKVDFDIYRELAIKLGQGDQWPWQTLEEYYDARLKPMGYTHKEYANKIHYESKVQRWKKYEQTGFATPTGKVELYSTVFEKLGYDPLPKYQEPTETYISNPELARKYPLTLITGGRFSPMYHSEWRQVDSARRLHPYPLLQIHPDTAEKLGISEGDWAWIEGVRGRVRQKATLFSGIKPNVIHAEHGWWFPELPGEEPWLHGVWESNINVLTDDDPDVCNQLSGTWPLKTVLCIVYKVKEY